LFFSHIGWLPGSILNSILGSILGSIQDLYCACYGFSIGQAVLACCRSGRNRIGNPEKWLRAPFVI
jgi:hypothetical protein